MKEFQEIKDLVKKKGFGTAFYGNVNGEPVYLSRGVREVFLGEDGNIQNVIAAVTKFQHADYGTAAEHGKTPEAGHEYGRYEIEDLWNLLAGPDDDKALWIHKDGKAIIVYFKFER